ncbi:hypothetical protein B0H14DRAFT_2225685, partial [Mycena olivaceomarginata]
IQLGTTSIWDIRALLVQHPSSLFYDRHSEFTGTGRANAEVELSPSVAPTVVLNLAELWGGQRVVRNWFLLFLEQTRWQASLHLIHGLDLARTILAGVHTDSAKAAGQRW